MVSAKTLSLVALSLFSMTFSAASAATSAKDLTVCVDYCFNHCPFLNRAICSNQCDKMCNSPPENEQCYNQCNALCKLAPDFCDAECRNNCFDRSVAMKTAADSSISAASVPSAAKDLTVCLDYCFNRCPFSIPAACSSRCDLMCNRPPANEQCYNQCNNRCKLAPEFCDAECRNNCFDEN